MQPKVARVLKLHQMSFCASLLRTLYSRPLGTIRHPAIGLRARATSTTRSGSWFLMCT
jgi:hypothetical protein